MGSRKGTCESRRKMKAWSGKIYIYHSTSCSPFLHILHLWIQQKFWKKKKNTIPEISKHKTWFYHLQATIYIVDEESAYNAGDPCLIPGLGEGHGSPLLYSCLENPMDRGAWRTTVHEVAKSLTQLRTSPHICIAFALLSIKVSRDDLKCMGGYA